MCSGTIHSTNVTKHTVQQQKQQLLVQKQPRCCCLMSGSPFPSPSAYVLSQKQTSLSGSCFAAITYCVSFQVKYNSYVHTFNVFRRHFVNDCWLTLVFVCACVHPKWVGVCVYVCVWYILLHAALRSFSLCWYPRPVGLSGTLPGWYSPPPKQHTWWASSVPLA